MIRLAYIQILLLLSLSASAQDFTVRSLTAEPFDLTASKYERLDLNGRKCGMLKVQCVLDGMTFAGNVMGEAEHHDGEYWVYLTPGTKMIAIHHPKVLPLKINFLDYLPESIRSATTYRLVLQIPDALYAAVVGAPGSGASQPASPSKPSVQAQENHTLKGTVVEVSGDPLIGASVICGDAYGPRYRDGWAVATDIDGNFELRNIPNGAVVKFSYIGYKAKEITFSGKIPPEITVVLKEGKGTEKEEYYYDPDDTSEYFDLKGNRLPSRPIRKGTYLRITDGKPEKFIVR